MLIISKHKDYYDSAIGLGIDKSIVYERKYEELKLEVSGYYPVKNTKYPVQINDLYDLFRPFIQSHRYDRGVDFFMVGFCGKLIPAFRWKGMSKDNNYDHEHVELIYDLDENIERFKSVNLPNDIAYYSRKFNREREAQLKNAWEEVTNTDIIDLHRHYNTPVFIIECGQNIYWSERGRFHINPILKDYGFVRLYDPYTAFQEIQMYISGVLPSGDDIPETKMNEKQKVNQHGFDDKYGFRTRPKKKKGK